MLGLSAGMRCSCDLQSTDSCMHGAGPLAKQNIKDRYYGVNDPVADKMLNRVNAMPKVVPPEDPTITTLYVGGIAPEVQESDLRGLLLPLRRDHQHKGSAHFR